MNMARLLDRGHREKYPYYVYSSKEAQFKKALCAEAHYLKICDMKSRKTNSAMSSRHNPEQGRGLQETMKGFRGQIQQNMFLSVGNNLNQQYASHKKAH
jgi:hypothetical protein